MFVVISHRTKEKEQEFNENTQGKRSFKSLCRLKEATCIYLEYVPLAKYVLTLCVLRETGSSGLGYVRKVRQSAHDLAFSVQQRIVVLNLMELVEQ